MRNILIVIALFAALLAATLHIYTQPKPIENNTTEIVQKTPEQNVTESNLFEKAQEMFNAGGYQEAIDIYAEIIDKEPQNAKAYQLTAHTYRYWQKYDEAEEWFLKAIQLEPESAYYYTDLGKLYRSTHEFEKAEAAFKKSLEIEPDSDITYGYGLGYLYLEEELYEQSEEAFLKAVSLNPKSETAYMGLGDLYREMGRFEESEQMYQKAFEINPKSESYLGLAWLYNYQGRHEDAIVVLRSYLENIREKGEVYYTLSVNYVALNRIDEAKEALAHAMELNPGNELYTSLSERLSSN